jgi:hypothetical protein
MSRSRSCAAIAGTVIAAALTALAVAALAGADF